MIEIVNNSIDEAMAGRCDHVWVHIAKDSRVTVRDNGWGIPSAEMQDPGRRDAADHDLLLETIEQDVVPLYYQHDENGLPSEWIRRSKRAMSTVIPAFSMRRMLQDYTEALYKPAAACAIPAVRSP